MGGEAERCGDYNPESAGVPEFVSYNLGCGKRGQDLVRVASLTAGFRRSDLQD